VVVAVLKQVFPAWALIELRPSDVVAFGPGKSEHAVEIADEFYFGKALQPLNVIVGQRCVADVAVGDESKIVFQLFDFADKFGLKVFLLVDVVQTFFEVFDVSVATQNLKTVTDFVNAVVNGFELGSLVDNVFRRGNLAAVVQPGGNMQCIPVFGTHFEIAQRAAFFLHRGGCQQAGNDRNALAVCAGIGRLGVDGTGQNFNERFQKLTVGFVHAAVFENQAGQG